MSLLWMIDDSLSNLAVAEATAALVPRWNFAGHASGAEGVAAFRAAARQPKTLPDAVLIDFYLGDTTGDRVAMTLRALAPPGWRGLLIGHSSVAAMSRAIVAAGADTVLRKRSDERGINPDLLAWLGQPRL